MDNYYFNGLLCDAIFTKNKDYLKIQNNFCDKKFIYKIWDMIQDFKSDIKFNKNKVYFKYQKYFLFEPIEYFNTLDTHDKKWEFLSGYIDMCSHIHVKKSKDLEIIIYSNSLNFLHYIYEFMNIPGKISSSKIYIKYTFTNVYDLLGKLNNASHIKNFFHNHIQLNECKIIKNIPEAIIPSKTRFSDVGFDLSIIKEYKKLNSKTTLYDTGISIQVPCNFYAEIVPRSSLSKTGYIMTNSIGIIDRSYTGNILISLTKICDDAINLNESLPFRCCQIIFRRQYYFDIIMIDNTDNTKIITTRNEGGYGSTGFK